MAGKVTDAANNMFSSIGAVQTLVENFPMSFSYLGEGKFSTSFDVISKLLKMLGVTREEMIDVITDALCGDMKDDGSGNGFIATTEEVVKMALETNIINIMNCTTNPIISNELLDAYTITNGVEVGGSGITLNIAEIDFTGMLNKNPFYDKQFYFDTDNYNATDVYKSKDFNAFLWYIINKSDKSQTTERIWDNRYKASIYGNNVKDKDIIKCTYIDDAYPNTDSIIVQICGGRKESDKSTKLLPANYYKTRKITKGGNNFVFNKTIFEFNHHFLSSIKLYEPKVLVSEIVEHLLGNGNLSVNLGFSLNEEIIQGKIQQIIKNVIEADDLEVNDCFYSFSNEEYNEMLETAEKNRFNIIDSGYGFQETDPNEILNNLTGITSGSTLLEHNFQCLKWIPHHRMF